jgi:isopenicillin N synthase-like dioxygenase
MKDIIEEPCTLLAHPDISGSNVASAVSFLSSSRIRQWKPKNLSQKQKGLEYCYIDYDEKNQINDIMLSGGQNCTPDAFGNNPFINRVFQDDKLDNARTFPHNKCVLEIDPTKVTGESSDAFWSNVSQLHCAGIESQIYRENLTIKADVDKNMLEVSRMTKLVAAQDVDIDNQRKSKNEILSNLRICTERISFLQKITIDLSSKLDEIKSAYASYTKTFNFDKLNNEDYIKKLASENSNLTTSIESFKKQILEIQKENITTSRKNEEADRAYNSIYVDYEKRKEEVFKLNRDCVNDDLKWRNCTKQDATVRNLLKVCTTSTVTTNKNIKDLETGYKNCEEIRNMCFTNLQTLIQNIRDVMVEYKYFYDKYSPCINQQLPSCQSESIKIGQLLNNEKQEHQNWKNLPHYNCLNEKVEKEDSDAKWERNKTTCENMQRNKEQLYDKYVGLLAVEYQNKLNKIQSCTIKKHQIISKINNF